MIRNARRFSRSALVAIMVATLLPIQSIASALSVGDYVGQGIYHYGTECIGASSGSITLSGKDAVEKALSYFMQNGVSLAGAAGIIGNFQAESGLNPSILEGGGTATSAQQVLDFKYRDPNTGRMRDGSFGLAQWLGGRKIGLINYQAQQNLAFNDYAGELGFTLFELKGSYSKTFSKIEKATDPIQAAIDFHRGYEVSADSDAKIRQTRGANAQKIYDQYKDAAPVAGTSVTAGSAATSTNADADSCATTGDGSVTTLQQLVAKYAWPTYHAPVYTDMQPAYKSAISTASAAKRFVGGTNFAGIDCGGFITTLMYNSGYDKSYNYGGLIADGAGGTKAQEQWAKDNWKNISVTDVSQLLPGDVAFDNSGTGHTWIFVGKIDGFESQFVSASLDERAPMADTVTSVGSSATHWYRKA